MEDTGDSLKPELFQTPPSNEPSDSPPKAANQEVPGSIRETDNVQVFISSFLASDIYSREFGRYFLQKQVKEGVTEEEKQKVEELKHTVFENSDDGMHAMYEFFSTRCRFTYNPMRYKPELASSVRDYLQSIKELQEAYKEPTPDTDRIVNADVRRTAMHLQVGQGFFDHGIVNNRKHGEFLARVIAVESGLEQSSYIKPEAGIARASVSANINARTG